MTRILWFSAVLCLLAALFVGSVVVSESNSSCTVLAGGVNPRVVVDDKPVWRFV